MQTPRSAIVVLFVIIGLFAVFIAGGCNTSSPQVAPVDYSSLMRDAGERYKDLYIAAKQDKWEFAEYQAKKIRVLMDRAVAIHPASAKDTKDFIQEAYPGIIDVIGSKDLEQFEAEYGRFASHCNTCHSAQNVGYLALTIPTVSDSPMLDAGKQAVGEGGDGGDGASEAASKEDVEKACTICHIFERVESAPYSGDQWNDVIGRMTGKGCPVPDDQVDAFVAYLDNQGG